MITELAIPQDLFALTMRLDAPLFQRPYVWNREDQWAPLWEDVRGLAEAWLGPHVPGPGHRPAEPHFLGAVVLQDRQTSYQEMRAATIIDGQQRLTTLQLLLHALADVLAARGLDALAASAARLTRNDDATAARLEDAFKVWPTNRDRGAYTAVMLARDPAEIPAAHRESPFAQADAYFRSVMGEWLAGVGEGNKQDTDALANRAAALLGVVTRGLRLVIIRLGADDDAQAIFETLNARGTPLTAMDLIKNYLFQKLDPHAAETQELYDRYWSRFETPFWEQEISTGRVKQARAVAFLGWWLAARTRAVIPARTTFSAFKRHTLAGGDETAVLADLSAAAQRYEALDAASHTRHGELDPLAMFNYRVDVLGLDVLKPLTIWLQDPVGGGAPAVPDDQRRRLLAAVESWIVRRALVKEASTGMNRFVVERLLRAASAEPDRMGERVEALLAAQTASVSYWPDDEEVRAALATERIYRTMAQARVRMVLEAIEDRRRGYSDGHRRAEAPVVRGTCTIEHLMPQQWRLNWDEGADEATAAECDHLVHTLGNLTLATQGLNSSLSNGSWEAKRAALDTTTGLLTTRDVLREHPEAWTDDDIRERTAVLTEEILAIWPVPAGHVHRVPQRALSVNNATMKDLLEAGLLAAGDELVGVARDGRTVQGVVDAAGRLMLDDVAYAYPSKPASRVRGTSANGWTFWHLRSSDGPTLDDLRARLLTPSE
ncbi:Protein of unknown function [Actinomyces ruminicola]|uniref:DUF262 domain-containing protein n=1 Tax=Actinomyces ruminicola TaxID=332524 RepID=A0A1H0CKQ0_9ACTO|nr:DUF262 domain-containing protein [Actinomyces ruminicola]SDN58456.1 Protein of unknown function [Actinomyces ruminicola]